MRNDAYDSGQAYLEAAQKRLVVLSQEASLFNTARICESGYAPRRGVR